MAKNYLEKYTEYPQVMELIDREIGKKTRAGMWRMAAEILKLPQNSWRRYDFYNLCDGIEKHRIREGMEESPPDPEVVERNIEINRAAAIELFGRELQRIRLDPERLSKKAIDKLTRLYKVVREETEAAERTKISRGKLKLEAVRTLFPYERMSIEELKKLKESIDASFTRILQLKSGEARAG